mgnify:CR=1 FL=1
MHVHLAVFSFPALLFLTESERLSRRGAQGEPLEIRRTRRRGSSATSLLLLTAELSLDVARENSAAKSAMQVRIRSSPSSALPRRRRRRRRALPPPPRLVLALLRRRRLRARPNVLEPRADATEVALVPKEQGALGPL